MILLGWTVGCVVFIVVSVIAVDYIGGRIDGMGKQLESLEWELRSIKETIELSRDDSILQSELKELHNILAGGLAALIAIGTQAHNVDRAKLSEEQAYETLSAFAIKADWYRMMGRWTQRTEEKGEGNSGEHQA